MKNIIGVIEKNGDEIETTWHISGNGVTDHATLCGVDGEDPAIGQMGLVEPGCGQKIDCETCKTIWAHITELDALLIVNVFGLGTKGSK